MDKIESETGFIFNLNRFNVLTSRAKSKLIFIVSNEIIEFIPNDKTMIDHAAKYNYYVNKFCNQEEPLIIIDAVNQNYEIRFRYKM